MNNNSRDIITAEQVTKVYQEGKMKVSVLKGVDFSIGPKELVGIVGSSGSGKSTFLHVLAGLEKPSSGSVIICGQNMYNLKLKAQGQLRNRSLGFVYQFHHLLPEFTAIENVAMPLWIRGVNITEANDKAESHLESVGLLHRLSHKPTELSGGERQRAALARALITEPACLLADEPTGNLDKSSASQVFELLLDLHHKRDTSLILVTHDEQLATRMNRVLRMEDGVLFTN